MRTGSDKGKAKDPPEQTQERLSECPKPDDIGQADFVIVSFVDEEVTAVQDTLGLTNKAQGRKFYYWNRVQSKVDGSEYLVALTQSLRGEVAAASATKDVLEDWKPLCVLLVGIAGGVKGNPEAQLGNVVASELIHYYGMVKVVDGKVEPRDVPYTQPSPFLRQIASDLSRNKVPWWERILDLRPEGQGDRSPGSLIGEIISGDMLLGDPQSPILEVHPVLQKLLSENTRASAVEMESVGAAHAIHESHLPHRIHLFVMRGISDFVNQPENQQTRDMWRKFASSAPAAFALCLIENTPRQAIPKMERRPNPDSYRTKFVGDLKGLPIQEPEFQTITVSWRGPSFKDNFTPLHTLADRTAKRARVILRSPGGGGKTYVLRRIAERLASDERNLPVYLSLKDWKEWHSEYWLNLRNHPQAFELKLDYLLQACSLSDLTSESLVQFSKDLICFVILDGLNEVYGQDIAREIIDTLNEFVRRSSGRACLLVADRTQPRAFIGERWESTILEPASAAEVRLLLKPEGSFDLLSDSDKSLLRIPFFLNIALKSPSPILGSAAKAIESYFVTQLKINDAELTRIAGTSFYLYEKYKSRVFPLNELKEKLPEDDFRRLEGTLEISGTSANYDHQLKHDYLAARHLAALREWSWENFDIVSFQSNSFDALSLVVEQLSTRDEVDNFLKATYDWNFYATVWCMTRSIRLGARHHKKELEAAILALAAERMVSDPVRRTRERLARILKEFPAEITTHFLDAKKLKEVFLAVEGLGVGGNWFLKWKTLFKRTYDAGPLAEEEIQEITSLDSIIGWTIANVIRRFPSDESMQRQLRTLLLYYSGTNNKTVQWRIVHALGCFPDKRNIDALTSILSNCDSYVWARYGAARSLVEIAAKAINVDLRIKAFENLSGCIGSQPLVVLEEIRKAVFVVPHPDDWDTHAIKLLEQIRDFKVCQPDREIWDQALTELRQFCEQRKSGQPHET